MQEYINKAQHNEDFHNCIHEKFPQAFHDWKTIALFYSAIHFLKALGLKKGIKIGETHEAIAMNCNPKSRSRIIEINGEIWDNYYLMYQYSRNARYQGFIEADLHHKLMAAQYGECKTSFRAFRILLRGEGIKTN